MIEVMRVSFRNYSFVAFKFIKKQALGRTSIDRITFLHLVVKMIKWRVKKERFRTYSMNKKIDELYHHGNLVEQRLMQD